jgi:hypothetical protein
MRAALILCVALAFTGAAWAQQEPDTQADLSVAHPAFHHNDPEPSPRVVIDGGHHNFHTVDGRYAPFAQLLRNNGMRVSGGTAPIDDAYLATVEVLVIANPLAAVNAPDHWELPTPSAFTPAEIEAIHRYVEGGGALLLIADHMPFAGAAHDLAASFGVEFENGFAFSSPPGPQQPDLFSRENGGLVDDPIFANVHQVRTFTGSAFRADGDRVRPILRLNGAWRLYEPQVAWEFDEQTRTVPADGLLQGALVDYGSGRVAVFGEAAMFTAQVAGPQRSPMGLRAPGAEENKLFVLDVVNWLAGAN